MIRNTFFPAFGPEGMSLLQIVLGLQYSFYLESWGLLFFLMLL